MDLPTNIVIKKERSTFEFPDKNDNVVRMDFHVKIEVENQDTEYDWSIQNQESSENTKYATNYEALKEYCYQKCLFCHRLFPNSFNLLQHNVTHLEIPLKVPKLYQCNYCLIYCTTRRELARHIGKYHEAETKQTKGMHQCNICLKRFKYNNWHDHISNVHGNKELKCAYCNEVFKCRRYLIKHENKHKKHQESTSKIKCDFCPKVFRTRDSVYQHKKSCHNVSEVQCKICNSTLKCISYLNAHMRRVHYNDGKIHKCHICMKQFKSPRYVSIHVKNSHVNSRRKPSVVTCDTVQCQLCARHYKNQERLQLHLKKCGVVEEELKVE